jgi:hypothetical protein
MDHTSIHALSYLSTSLRHLGDSSILRSVCAYLDTCQAKLKRLNAIFKERKEKEIKITFLAQM